MALAVSTEDERMCTILKAQLGYRKERYEVDPFSHGQSAAVMQHIATYQMMQ